MAPPMHTERPSGTIRGGRGPGWAWELYRKRKGNLGRGLKAYQKAWELNRTSVQAARKAREIRIRLLEKKQG